MEKIESIDISSQPYLWKQFIAKDHFRGYHPIGLLIYYMKKIVGYSDFHKKRSPSYMFDELIIGSNLILNTLKIIEIFKNSNSKVKKINIGLFMPREQDYWYYELITKDIFWESISALLNLEIKKYEDLLDYLIKIKPNNINLIVLDKRYKVEYLEYDEKITNGWYIYFSNEKNKFPNVDPLVKTQNDIKKILEVGFFSKLNSVLNKLLWINKGKEFFQPIALSKKVYLTSLPQGWMSIKSKIFENKVVYEHMLSQYSYGSSKEICTKIEDLEDCSLKSLNDFKLN